MTPLRPSVLICIVLLTVGCNSPAPQDEIARDEKVDRPSTEKRAIQLPPSTKTDALPTLKSEPVFLDSADSAALRSLLSGKRLERRPESSPPTRAEQFHADGTWWASVEEVIATHWAGNWRVVKLPDSAPEVCVTVRTKNGASTSERGEICRRVRFSKDQRVAEVPFLYHPSLVASEFEVVSLEDI